MPSNDPFAPPYEHYKAPEDIAAWVRRCGFKTIYEACDALEVNRRTFHRWLLQGLPGKAMGRIAARLMQHIEQEHEEAASYKVTE